MLRVRREELLLRLLGLLELMLVLKLLLKLMGLLLGRSLRCSNLLLSVPCPIHLLMLSYLQACLRLRFLLDQLCLLLSSLSLLRLLRLRSEQPACRQRRRRSSCCDRKPGKCGHLLRLRCALLAGPLFMHEANIKLYARTKHHSNR